MGVPVFVLGESGSGKSASLRNFKFGEIGIFNVAGKLLPFKTEQSWILVNNARYATIQKWFVERGLAKPQPELWKEADLPTKPPRSFAIDDSQYLMSFEEFDKINQKGYEKFTQMALNFKRLLDLVVLNLPPDVIVYFLHHVETTDNGLTRAKATGKMLQDKLVLEGLFSVVLFCRVEQGRHVFVTQSDGSTTAKSPMGMFDSLMIDNDLKMVDDKIREYYNL